MARTVDHTVLIVSALAAFFATLFGMLLALEPDSPSPAVPVAIVRELPDVAAPPLAEPRTEPPAQPQPIAPQRAPAIAPPQTRSSVEQTLLELGISCRDGDCFSGR